MRLVIQLIVIQVNEPLDGVQGYVYPAYVALVCDKSWGGAWEQGYQEQRQSSVGTEVV